MPERAAGRAVRRAGLLLALAWGAPARGGAGDLLVSLSPAALRALRADAVLGPAVVWCRPSVGACLLQPRPGQGPALAAALRSRPGVRAVDPDARIHPQGDRAGTGDCPAQWEFLDADFDLADAIGDGSGARVAILDGGFRLDHEELAALRPWAWDYGEGDLIVSPVAGVGVPGHGTFIAGLLGAAADNGRGREGVAPGAELALLKIADGDGALWWSIAVDAIGGLLEDAPPISVLNYSLAGSAPPTAMIDAVAALGAADVVLVAAAGNCGAPSCADADNDRWPLYPANDSGAHVLTVAGTTPGALLNPYSHYGALSVDLAAPGVDLCSLEVEAVDAYAVASGTSYAAPLVAGAVARLRGRYPGLRADEAVQLINAAVIPTADLEGRVATGGRLDALEALSLPLVAIGLPAAVEGDGPVPLPLRLESRAGAGAAYVVIGVPDGVTVSGPGGLLVALAAGEAPPWGGEPLTAPAWVLPLHLGAAGADGAPATDAVELTLENTNPDAVYGELQVLVVGQGARGATLAQPAAAGGRLGDRPAWAVPLALAAAAGAGGGADGGAADTAGGSGADGATPADPAADAADSKGGGCRSVPHAPPLGLWSGAVAGAALVRCRRRFHPRRMGSPR